MNILYPMTHLTESQKKRFLNLMRAKLLLAVFIKSETKIVICFEFVHFLNREFGTKISTVDGLRKIEIFFPELYETYGGAGAWMETNKERLENIRKVIKVLEDRTTPNG